MMPRKKFSKKVARRSPGCLAAGGAAGAEAIEVLEGGLGARGGRIAMVHLENVGRFVCHCCEGVPGAKSKNDEVSVMR